MYMKYFNTRISNRRINQYIAQCLKDFLAESTKEGNDIIDGLLKVTQSEHWELDLYIDIPRGVEGDHLVRDVTNKIEKFMYEFLRYHEQYVELLIEAYNKYHRIDTYANRDGIWVEIPLIKD